MRAPLTTEFVVSFTDGLLRKILRSMRSDLIRFFEVWKEKRQHTRLEVHGIRTRVA